MKAQFERKMQQTMHFALSNIRFARYKQMHQTRHDQESLMIAKNSFHPKD